MFCITCRRSTVLAGARYCAYCGAPLDTPLWSEESATQPRQPMEAPTGEQVACARCGKANPEEHVHCVFCGNRLGGSRPALVIDEGARDRATELVAQAREYRADGRLQRVQECCYEAIQLDPQNAEAHALLAEVYWSRGSLGGALHEMTVALRLNPGNREWEQRLREWREEQERAIAPLLRSMEDPTWRPTRPRPKRRAFRVSWQWPSWAPAVGLVLGLMLLLGIAPYVRILALALSGLRWTASCLIGILAAVFVYYDARRLGMTQPMALLWAAGVLLSCGLGLLVYLLVTRAPR